MDKFWLIARHDFFKHLLRPGFIGLTLAIPLIGLAVMLVMSFLGRDVAPTALDTITDAMVAQNIGYVDQSGLIVAVPDYLPADQLLAFADESEARAAVDTGEIAAFYLIPPDYLQHGQITRFAPQVQFNVGDDTLIESLLRFNLVGLEDPRIAQRLDQPLNLEVTPLDTDGQPVPPVEQTRPERTGPLNFAVPYIFAMILFMTIITSAGYMLQSVVDEKENRTMEILLTSARPWQILGGKVLGLGGLGLIQITIWLGSGALLLLLGAGQLGLFPRFPIPMHVWGLALAYFLLGYLVYASLMAGAGATITTTRESSQLTTLIVIPFVIPLWFLGAIVDQPDGMLSTVLSIIPLTAPITMIIRLTLTDVTWWQILLSLLLLVGTVVLFIWGAGRLFRETTLLAGKKFSIGQIIRTLRAGSDTVST